MLGDELAVQQTSKGCRGATAGWWTIQHYQCSPGLGFRTSPVEHCYQWSGCKSGMHSLQDCWWCQSGTCCWLPGVTRGLRKSSRSEHWAISNRMKFVKGKCQSKISDTPTIYSPKAGKRARRHMLWGKAEDTWVVYTGEKEAKRQPHCSLQITEEGNCRGKCWSLLTGNQWQDTEMVQNCTRIGSDCALGKISPPWEWSDTGTGFAERCLIPQTCQCSRGICINYSVLTVNKC